MKKRYLILPMLLILVLTACTTNIGSTNDSSSNGTTWDNNTVSEITTTSGEEHNYELTTSSNGTYTYTCTECSKSIEFTITYESGTENAYTVSDSTITFNTISEDTVYSITGELNGNIIINAGEDYKLELTLNGFTLTSSTECPLVVLSADKAKIAAKDGTKNYIYDNRAEISDDDEESYKGAIHAEADLNIQGNGELYIKSVNNNGIHTKDDLNVKNLTLQVECEDNALKGNDSVTIESGTLTLISRTGDGIKTSNSDISSKGNQRGTITISGGTILVYAACDGIDASYDVVIDSSNVNLEIYTDKYSKYSEDVDTSSSSDVIYVRYSYSTYKYSIKFYNSDTDYVFKNSSSYTQTQGDRGRTYYYYPIDRPSGYSKMQIFVYSSSQTQGQETDYLAKTDLITINEYYNAIYIQTKSSSLSYGWTNYTAQSSYGPGGMGGNMGGNMQDGNSDKGDYSTKGIKADNIINISAGTIKIQSYDDSIHANNDNTLENGDTPLGNVIISGGTLNLYSNDDGVHADGSLTISGGTINVSNSYEGLEGLTISISSGDISVISSDDGMNSTATTGTGISITGGTIYVNAGGDGLDANSRSSYTGIVFNGGKTIIFSSSSNNSSIDTECGYTYNSGVVVAVGPSGGMNASESRNCSNFSSVGKYQSLSLSSGSYVVVSNVVTAKSPFSLNSVVIVLGASSSSISKATSTSYTLNSNGVYWN